MVEILSVLRWLVLVPPVLVVLVLLGATLGEWSLRKMTRDLARRPCPGCGTPFGEAAVRAGRASWDGEFARRQAEHPGVRFRTLARWPLRCPGCGREFVFQPNDEQLLAG